MTLSAHRVITKTHSHHHLRRLPFNIRRSPLRVKCSIRISLKILKVRNFSSLRLRFKAYRIPSSVDYASKLLTDPSESIMKPSLSPPTPHAIPTESFLKPMPIDSANSNWSSQNYQAALGNQQYPLSICQGASSSSSALDYHHHHHQAYSSSSKYWS